MQSYFVNSSLFIDGKDQCTNKGICQRFIIQNVQSQPKSKPNDQNIKIQQKYINRCLQFNLQFQSKQIMGGVCFSQATLHHNVHKLPNEVPPGDQYMMKESHSVRFSQVTVNRINSTANNNQYKFVMKIFMSSMINDTISVNLNILNESIQKLLTDNYQLKIKKRMIIDIFTKKLSSTLVQAKNQRSSVEFSIQIFSFRGYTSETFKKCLYALYIITKKLAQIQFHHVYYHSLIDHFVYGCNPDKQALTLLYERAQTSLANVAEYRKLAEWPWTTQEKLKIFIDLMNGVYFLHKKKIYHREIRPSNIFYIQRLGRYVLGSFMKSIQLQDQSQDQHNRTVYGIEYMYRKGCDNDRLTKVGDYLKENKQHAPYIPKEIDYHGLSVVLHTLETLDIVNLQRNFKDKVMLTVHTEWEKIYDTSFDEVRQKILKIAHKYDIEHVKLAQDNQVSNLVQRLASITHKSMIQDYIFEIYDTLGYESQFSNTTHQLIQKNNEQNRSLQNAYLLKNLAEFYQKSGAKGTQYYCNACLLFLKRTERNLSYGNLQSAKEDYYQAEKCYISFSQNFQSHSTYIELHRIKALIKIHDNDIPNALDIIKSTFEYGARRKISIEKQMTLLLTFARIHLKGNKFEKKIGQEKLKNGLAISQNKGAFENITSCNIHTANFLYELGCFYHQKFKMLQLLDQKSKFKVSQEYLSEIRQLETDFSQFPKFKALAESNLKACLEIREKQNIQVIETVHVLKKLGYFYYDVDMLIQAKKTFQRCQTLLRQIAKQVNPMIVVQTLYYFGSTLFSLKQYQQAQRKYQKALDLFHNLNQYEINTLLKYNIEGNLGLTQFQLNKNSGEKNILEAMNKIKQLRSDKFYDYVFLKEKYNMLKESKKKRR